MDRALRRIEALIALTIVAVTAAVVLAALGSAEASISGPLEPEVALAAQPVVPAPARPAPAREPKPQPAGRVNPLVPLPGAGTPVLEVRSGKTAELRDEPGGDLVAELGSETEFGGSTVLTVAKRRGNWAGVPTSLLPNGELGWVELDSKAIAIDSVDESIVVDLSETRATLSEDGREMHSWTVSVGAAESPTPTGEFSITDKITEGLNPVYGCCALPLSANQPNPPPGWFAGTRMAIHGTSMPLGEANSAGCVRSAEEDLRLLIDRVPLGTPVTIRP